MTDHPLTDEICDAMIEDDSINELWFHTVEDSMRVAYDKGREDGRQERLIEVLHWLRATRYYGRVAELADQLEEAMRPQPQEDN